MSISKKESTKHRNVPVFVSRAITKNDSDEFIGSSNVRRPKITADEVAKNQKQFVIHLLEKMRTQGHSFEDLAKKLSVSYSWLIALKNGHRQIAKAKRQTIAKFADYLERPVIQIYIWCGFFKPASFVARRNLDLMRASTFENMSTDPAMIAIAPNPDDWENQTLWSNDAKTAMVRMYEILNNQLFVQHANLPAK